MQHEQLFLGVNVDHVATLREVRGTTYPSPLEAARLCRDAGAHSVTVHLREDRRHIQDHDVEDLARERPLPLNLEMANSAEIADIALRLRPEEVCLVPERREELTTEGGLDVVAAREALRAPLRAFREAGIEVSLFIDPEPVQVEASAELGVPVVELHTGTFCDAEGAAAERELTRLRAAAEQAHQAGLRVNAGHGIHLGNIGRILEIPRLHTLNIGHSIVCHAVMVGMEEAVRQMLAAMPGHPESSPRGRRVNSR